MERVCKIQFQTGEADEGLVHTLQYVFQLSNPLVELLEYLPYDDVVAGLGLIPAAHYSSVLYPNAILRDVAANTAIEYSLGLKKLSIDGVPVQASVFKKVQLTGRPLYLILGDRDEEEWQVMVNENQTANISQIQMEHPKDSISMTPSPEAAPSALKMTTVCDSNLLEFMKQFHHKNV